MRSSPDESLDLFCSEDKQLVEQSLFSCSLETDGDCKSVLLQNVADIFPQADIELPSVEMTIPLLDDTTLFLETHIKSMRLDDMAEDFSVSDNKAFP